MTIPQAQRAKAEAFRNMHRGLDQLLVFNVWDVASAKAVAPYVKALATSSWAVAEARGYYDGEKVPLDVVEGLTARIARAVDLPVSLDFEAGYGMTHDAAASSVERVVRAGAVGINLEDGLVGGRRELASSDVGAKRIATIRQHVDALDLPPFINARTDVFLLKYGDAKACLAEAVRRANLYRDAGADGLFVPGLIDLQSIATLAQATPLPLNIMAIGDAPDLAAIAQAGALRISLAGSPMVGAICALAAGAADTVKHLRYGAILRP